VLFVASTQVSADATFNKRYTDWEKKVDPQGVKYTQCKYRYKKANGDEAYQYVVHYYEHPQKKNYYYWTKDGSHWWGKCIQPSGMGYNPNKMQWYKYETSTGSGGATITITITLPLGDCPFPADADPEDGIVSIPPPL
jgi:hypothetical protein